MSIRVIALLIVIIASTAAVHGSVPIIVNTPVHQRAAINLCSDAGKKLTNGDIAGAKRDVDAALRIDPKLWPALYIRAQIFKDEGKYELAI